MQVCLSSKRFLMLFVYVSISRSAFGQASFQGVGDLPGGSFNSVAFAVSGDGRIVVGVSHSNFSASPLEAFRWEDGSITRLQLPDGWVPESAAYAVSNDGELICGSANFVGGSPACVRPICWSDLSPIVLGSLGPGPANTCGVASGVSGIGTVVVGSIGMRSFRWSLPTGMEAIVTQNETWLELSALGVSDNGNIIVGRGRPPNGNNQAFLLNGNTLTGLPALAGQFQRNSIAHSISGNGIVAVGWATSEFSACCDACRWVSGVPYRLGFGIAGSTAWAADADGSHIVGEGAQGGAYVWDSMAGARPLREVLTCEYSLDLDGWELISARGISNDASVIVGYGRNPAGEIEGWIAHVPQIEFVDTDSDGISDCFDNCVAIPNHSQSDLDSDRVGDACDNCPMVGGELEITPDGCPVPFGPCCFPVGVCIDDTQRGACELVGGHYQGDGLGCDVDPDHDGLAGCVDNCPTLANANQDDADSDQVGDLCDNCPLIVNSNQVDSDEDGAGDECDGCPLDPAKIEPGLCGCGNSDADSDLDVVPDCFDRCADSPSNGHVNDCGCTTGGACCFPVGVCFESVEPDDCHLISGQYQGDGSDCTFECSFGDVTGNGTVDLADYASLQNCCGSYAPEDRPECTRTDVDLCYDVNLLDYYYFLDSFVQP